jgi:hypothetical protein
MTSYRSVTAASVVAFPELCHLTQPGDPYYFTGGNQDMLVLGSNAKFGALPYILIPRAAAEGLVNAYIEHVHAMLIFTVVPTDIGPGPIGLNDYSDAV